jgi:hypothetical protein
MKTHLFLAICITVLLVSCRKEAPFIPTNTISVSIDGTTETFNRNLTATETKNGGVYILAITGFNTPDFNSDNLQIEIHSTSPITAGTYPIPTNEMGFHDSTLVYFVAGYSTYYSAVNATSPNSITVTRITSTAVQGTFNVTLTGPVASTTPSTYPNKTFTNGNFDVGIPQNGNP